MSYYHTKSSKSFFFAEHNILDWCDPDVKGLFHHFYEIHYCLQGRMNLMVEDNVHEIVPGDIVLIDIRRMHMYTLPPGESAWPPPEKLSLGYNNAFLRSIFDDEEMMAVQGLFRPKSRKLYLNDDEKARITHVFWRMVREYDDKQDDSSSICRMLLGLLLLELKRLFTSPAEAASTPGASVLSAVTQVASYIVSNYADEELKLSLLADKFCFSRCYLARIFKEHTGFTTSEYIQNIRVSEAAKLLRSTDIPVTDIAGQVGYNDVSHFGRIFRKVMGVSARSYRAFG